jgi:hypothetical protein
MRGVDVSRVVRGKEHSVFGNGRVFISHTSTDTTRCDVMLAPLDAWQVDYWFDLLDLSAGQEPLDHIQRSLGDRDIFIRVCTSDASSSTWMTQEATLAHTLKSPNRSGAAAHHQPDSGFGL